MASYSLRVNLNDKWRKQWSSVPDAKLCFAMAVSNGGDKVYHNVVACTNDIEASIKISWTDKYQIAGNVKTSTSTMDSNHTTSAVRVKFGSKTNIAKDQANTISTGFGSDAPSDGFLFTNEVECSALLLCEIDGKFVPVYTSHAGNLSPGSSEVIIPKNKVYVWFSDDAKSSTMTETMGSAKEVEIDGPGDRTVTFDEAGNWTVV
ncbi:uncharacterized protein FIESC28_09844 [Fusarium coffeatum]|uniref:Uncharacterized protein n=1 Tax=Fusarium coffeatum TaxID=231269 RepID=A0A366QX99_9HYPO|nr:uncharacterized protein FIESC28_09844 [Fusarium coffeatum]RBR09513.1 hypothetical protein FIESC28_09844 [Fusarium coffeatum]